jgi:hypothetical protein
MVQRMSIQRMQRTLIQRMPMNDGAENAVAEDTEDAENTVAEDADAR